MALLNKHNSVLSKNLNKVLDENHCSLDVAWCVNGKHSLQNVHGFSPFQLATGKNPSLSHVATDELSAFSPMQTNEIIRQHLNNIHKAREDFIMSGSSKKIPRALRHNVRADNNNTFVTVYYKRA